jgi:tRNA pseudouridine38-40 synthase
MRLLGTHDFQAFRGPGDVRENTVRSITGVAVTPSGHHERLLEIRVTGNAFLYHMVRIIAGTLVDIGRAKLDPDAITRAIETGDRLQLGVTAPAAGLFLEQIVLDECGEDEWPYHLDGAPIEARKRT